MKAFALTPLAKADICEIWAYIAEDNGAVADRVEQAIYDACESIAKSPFIGHTRRRLTKREVRFWAVTPYTNYLIVYRPETTPTQVVAILHGRRNVGRVLKDRLQ